MLDDTPRLQMSLELRITEGGDEQHLGQVGQFVWGILDSMRQWEMVSRVWAQGEGELGPHTPLQQSRMDLASQGLASNPHSACFQLGASHLNF